MLHLLYHSYNAFKTNQIELWTQHARHCNSRNTIYFKKASKITYHQVMKQLPCTGIPNFEKMIIHSRNNIVIILVPSYHGYFRLHKFVFFWTCVTILKSWSGMRYFSLAHFNLKIQKNNLVSHVNNQTREGKLRIKFVSKLLFLNFTLFGKINYKANLDF